MTALSLRLGSVATGGYELLRSGVRWLVPDGHHACAGEPVAFCTIALAGGGDASRSPFRSEQRDFQVVLCVAVAGRLWQDPRASRGGDMDLLTTFRWIAEQAIGRLDVLDEDRERLGNAEPFDLLFLAGRRMSEFVEVRTGLLTGWHERKRAWWGEGSGPSSTLVSLATCEQYGIFSGRAGGFLDSFAAARGPAHLVVVQDEPLVPSSGVLVEQIERTAAEREAIRADLAATFLPASTSPEPADWVFAGALANALTRNPLDEPYDLLGRSGLGVAPGPSAVFLSLSSEGGTAGRHRTLGYTIAMHGFRMAQSSPVLRHWMRANFEPVRRTVDDIRQSYLDLLGHLERAGGARLLVLNRNTTPHHEHIASYADHPAPLSATLSGIRARELNEMLDDLARDGALDVIDADAMLAEYGLRDHMPDGTHYSGQLQTAIRESVFRVLDDRGLSGFAARASR